MNIPKRIVVTEACLVLDGGSVFLEARDGEGVPLTITLEWSIDDQIANTTRLRLNGEPITKRSEEERDLLHALENAGFDVPPIGEGELATPQGPRLVMADDIARVLDALEEGGDAPCRAIIAELIEKVRSDLHVNGRPRNDLSSYIAEGIAACKNGEHSRAVELLAPISGLLSPAQTAYFERSRRLAAKEGS